MSPHLLKILSASSRLTFKVRRHTRTWSKQDSCDSSSSSSSSSTSSSLPMIWRSQGSDAHHHLASPDQLNPGIALKAAYDAARHLQKYFATNFFSRVFLTCSCLSDQKTTTRQDSWINALSLECITLSLCLDTNTVSRAVRFFGKMMI